ncbi:hypothetical protein HDU98_005932 [Podochytrium sp. JEL0797]|nr:hypothetical protein HDU98_005932 [Podochytrium sp. JEL0797]
MAKSKSKHAPSKKTAKEPTPPAAAPPPATPQGNSIPIPDPPVKDDNFDESRKGKKSTGGAGLGGHLYVKQLLGTAPKVPNPNSLELKLEELDEKMLRVRLEAVDKDLAEYKKKCAHYKGENEWYRNEIESTEKDTTEYIRYLLSKKLEKQTTISTLETGKSVDEAHFIARRVAREASNQSKISQLTQTILDRELTLEAKQQEMMGLSDVISKRSRHEAEIIRVRQDMADSERMHKEKEGQMERALLETRIKLQREADMKIQEMESAAQEKAKAYLAEHAAAMEAENGKLEAELRKCLTETQELLKRKEVIERENEELLRQKKMREDLLRIRIEKVVESQNREKKREAAKKERVLSAKRDIFKHIGSKYPNLKREGLLPSSMDSVTKQVDGSQEALRKATVGKAKSKFAPNGNQEKPVLKVTVMAGIDKVATPQADAELEKAKRAASAIAALSSKWEISDDSDEEFL